MIPSRPRLFLSFLCSLLLFGCSAPATPPPANMAPVHIPKAEPTRAVLPGPTVISPTATLLPNAVTLDVSIWVPPYLSQTMGAALEDPLRGLFVRDEARAKIRLQVGGEYVVSRWVYALVTPFASTLPGISGEELLARWQGQVSDPALLVDPFTYDMLAALWGPAGSGIQVVPQEQLLDTAWAQRPVLAIVPFEKLDPRWKVLPVDGLSPIHRDFDPAGYRLTVPISLVSDPERTALIRSNFFIPPSNLDPQKMTVVALSGVTALVRATASTMERRGLLYPAEDIRGWLLEADITHVSNEVPFAADCPPPNPVQESMRFCSQDEYIRLLEDIGTDLVELTGDHFQDWGAEAMLHTLELYRQRGWPYYGGGADLAEAQKALLLEHHGNRIAFIGCNAKGGGFAQAGPGTPGAAACDMDGMAAEIRRLAGEGMLVIATFQHFEYYSYEPQGTQPQDFRRMAEAGAAVVSGSQAHQPQGMEFWSGAFIHYGLGNLFFDQYGLCEACRQGLIDRHVFYDGRYLSTELLPIQFIDYARSRPMTEAEAKALFSTLFQASGW